MEVHVNYDLHQLSVLPDTATKWNLLKTEVETVMNARDILTVDIAGKLTTTWGALKTR